MRLSFAQNPEVGREIFTLLDVVFPGLRQGATHARGLGAPWESVSTPFAYFEDGRVVSHVGVIELPLVLLGREVAVASIHAVATHPDHRRRGHCGRLLHEALAYCDERYETAVLTTENPEIYEPFGFRILQEHSFTMQCKSGAAPSVGTDPMALRRLDLADASDRALLHRLIEQRCPVSEVVGVRPEKAVFFFNEGHRPLYYAEDLDVLLCLELDGEHLRLFDVVGPRLPPLEALAARMPQSCRDVVACFATDRFPEPAEARPYVFGHDGPSYLMARGPFAAENEPFTLPRSART